MGTISRILGVNFDLRKIVPGADKMLYKKFLASLKLSASDYENFAGAALELAEEKRGQK